MGSTLVAYFSITGVTESVALHLARAIEADLFEVVPVKNPQETESADPIFIHKDITGYDRIFVGLPIWWYAAPTVMHRFLSDYDLSGKMVVPFVTSGAGGLDKVRPRLLDSCPGADLKEACLLTEDMDDNTLRAWADSMY